MVFYTLRVYSKIIYFISKLFSLCFIDHIIFLVALCSPECTLTTDTCASLNNCKCGTADPCGPTLSNRCLNSVCVCGVSASCTSGTTVPVCLDQVGNTPGSTNTVATCKVNPKSIMFDHKELFFHFNR